MTDIKSLSEAILSAERDIKKQEEDGVGPRSRLTDIKQLDPTSQAIAECLHISTALLLQSKDIMFMGKEEEGQALLKLIRILTTALCLDNEF